MNTANRTLVRTIWVATRTMALFTAVLGLLYTVAITGVGQLVTPGQANGSLVHNAAGDPVGSALLGQPFTDAAGNPLPEYFQPRPSATDYDGAASSASNYGPENADLLALIAARKADVAAFNGVSAEAVPPDALTASASGLDPHISPEYAEIQVQRVAAARELPVDQVRALVAAHTEVRMLGFLGESTVNVLELNVALDALEG